MIHTTDGITNSARLFQESGKLIPGGVNSPVRSFNSVGGTPIFMKKGDGPYLWDEDGNRYIDYVGSWGPMILGHKHPRVHQEVINALENGFSFGTVTKPELSLAKKITELMPSIEMVRLVSSGTEACMSALRLARGFTGRSKFIKFIGCYHGHADMLLVKAGSGVATLNIPGSPGVPEGAVKDTLTVAFNDPLALKNLVHLYKDDLAAIIIEPIAGNMGFIRPNPGFLELIRTLCDESGALLIFDEVMTGFRVALGGAQSLFKVRPDLTTLGKIVGGGLPIGAFGGRKDIMEKLAPKGPIYQAGTLSGNPISVASGLATLTELEHCDYNFLSEQTKKLAHGLKDLAHDEKIPLSVDAEGGMFGFFFAEKLCTNYDAVIKTDTFAFNKFFHSMLRLGVYLAPSAYEAGFVSFAHDDSVIDETLQSAQKAFHSLNKA